MSNTKEVHIVLSKEVYDKLERQLPVPYVSDKTTDVQAGYMLGVQAVLKALRDGFTVG